MSKSETRPLAGSNVLVTGGARRLGRASALILANAGANVTITFRTSEREANGVVQKIRSLGVQGGAIYCDVTNEKSVRNAIKQTVREMGGLDIVVNNAGNYETVDFEKITVQQWDAIFASNTRGPFLVSREALKHLRKSKGKIINMGSLGGLQAWPTHAHYCSSKAALHMLTKVMVVTLEGEIVD